MEKHSMVGLDLLLTRTCSEYFTVKGSGCRLCFTGRPAGQLAASEHLRLQVWVSSYGWNLIRTWLTFENDRLCSKLTTEQRLSQEDFGFKKKKKKYNIDLLEHSHKHTVCISLVSEPLPCLFYQHKLLSNVFRVYVPDDRKQAELSKSSHPQTRQCASILLCEFSTQE